MRLWLLCALLLCVLALTLPLAEGKGSRGSSSSKSKPSSSSGNKYHGSSSGGAHGPKPKPGSGSKPHHNPVKPMPRKDHNDGHHDSGMPLRREYDHNRYRDHNETRPMNMSFAGKMNKGWLRMPGDYMQSAFYQAVNNTSGINGSVTLESFYRKALITAVIYRVNNQTEYKRLSSEVGSPAKPKDGSYIMEKFDTKPSFLEPPKPVGMHGGWTKARENPIKVELQINCSLTHSNCFYNASSCYVQTVQGKNYACHETCDNMGTYAHNWKRIYVPLNYSGLAQVKESYEALPEWVSATEGAMGGWRKAGNLTHNDTLLLTALNNHTCHFVLSTCYNQSGISSRLYLCEQRCKTRGAPTITYHKIELPLLTCNASQPNSTVIVLDYPEQSIHEYLGVTDLTKAEMPMMTGGWRQVPSGASIRGNLSQHADPSCKFATDECHQQIVNGINYVCPMRCDTQPPHEEWRQIHVPRDAMYVVAEPLTNLSQSDVAELKLLSQSNALDLIRNATDQIATHNISIDEVVFIDTIHSRYHVIQYHNERNLNFTVALKSFFEEGPNGPYNASLVLPPRTSDLNSMYVTLQEDSDGFSNLFRHHH